MKAVAKRIAKTVLYCLCPWLVYKVIREKAEVDASLLDMVAMNERLIDQMKMLQPLARRDLVRNTVPMPQGPRPADLGRELGKLQEPKKKKGDS